MIIHTWAILLYHVVFVVVFSMAWAASNSRLDRDDRHADLLERAAWMTATGATFLAAIYWLVQRSGDDGSMSMKAAWSYAPAPALPASGPVMGPSTVGTDLF